MRASFPTSTARLAAVPFIGAGLLLASWATAAPIGQEQASVPRIIDGTDASISDYPWQIALLSDAPGSYYDRQSCGGSILSADWVLTAAHCLDGSPKFVLAGISNLDTNSGGQLISVEEQISHPAYDPLTDDNDVALLRLSTPLDLSTADARVIPIMTGEAVARGLQEPGVVARISGWGNISSTSEDFPKQLQAALVSLLASDDPGLLWPPTQLTAGMLVAGVLAGGKDTCQGDSGGPLAVADDTTLVGARLAGVTSWGGECGAAGYPGIYARVSHYQSWIEQYVVNLFDRYGPQAQLMYLAYYGRPGDLDGVSYWAGRLAEVGGNWLADLVNAFGTSEEYTARFGSLSQQALIENLFLSLFNRTVDGEGLAFYLDLLAGSNVSGLNPQLRQSTLAQIALDVANGAQAGTTDAITMANKLSVAKYFTAAVTAAGRSYTESDIAAVAAFIAAVGPDAASVDAAKTQIQAYLQ